MQQIQTPNILGQFLAGREARREVDKQNFLAQNAGAIMQGDSNALAQFAQYDPEGAMGMMQQRQQMQARQQQMDISRERLQLAREEARQRAEAQAAKLSAAERERQAEVLSQGLSGAAYFYQQGDRQGYNEFLAQNNLDPQEYPFEMFPAIAAQADGVLEAYTSFQDMEAGPEPLSGAGKFYADREAGFVPADAEYTGGGVTVNTGDTGPRVGSIPQGYAVVDAPDTEAGYRMVPIPGGPEDTTEEDAQRREQQERYADVVLEDIGKVVQEVEDGGFPVTGAMGWATSGLPGTPARDVAARLDTIRANIGFDRLQQMRDASPTGGALGQVSEQENRLLQSTLGNLEQSQSREQFVDNLRRVEEIYLDIIHGKGNWEKTSEGEVVVGEGQAENMDFENMSKADLAQINPDDLTDEQVRAYNQTVQRMLGLNQ